jgi:hypothetical protein
MRIVLHLKDAVVCSELAHTKKVLVLKLVTDVVISS